MKSKIFSGKFCKFAFSDYICGVFINPLNSYKMKRILFFMLLSVWLISPTVWADEGEYDISLMNAGTLLDQIGIENIEKVYGLKVSGDLNGTDILTIRKMTNLRRLDMENANIVNGGLSYYEDYITSQNTVGTYFFREKTNLEKIVLPKTVENIEDYSFSGCTALTTVYIGENVTQIRDHVFSGCTALRNLRIEDGTKTLSLSTSSSSTPFYNCPLDTVYLGRNIDYGYRSDYRTYYNSPFKNKTTLVSLTIGKQVTSIGYEAFKGCRGMTSVMIGEGVQTIGNYAFSGCSRLPSITIPGSVTSIGYDAFKGCSGLTSVTIPNRISTIESNTFEDCSGLKEVIIGHSVETIKAAAFKGCSRLKKITSLNTIPPIITTTTFDEETIKGATLYVPASCKNIYWLHPYWENFSSIENSDYKAYDFEENGIYYHINGSTERTVEVTYKTPSDRGYSGEVIIPEEVLHNDTLYTVTSISGYAFHDCKALAAITVGKNIARIGNGAFSGCTGLKNLRIEEGTETLSLSTSSSSTPFDNCPLDTVYLGRNIDYSYRSGSSISYNSPFKNKTDLVSLTIGNQVTSIGSDAFSGCTGLKNLRIEEGTETLSLSTSSSSTPFDNCPLDTVYLGRNIDYSYRSGSSISYNSPFKNKTDLVSLTIGNQVTSIGSDAFSGCTGLKNLRIEDGTETLSLSTTSYSTPFDDCPLDTVYLGRNVPYSSYSPFKNKTTLVSLTIGNQVTSIHYDAFKGCSGMTSVMIGEGVTTIGSSAFSGCYGLTEITIPESVTYIDYDAFKGCSGLTSVTIGESVTVINDEAFSGCTGLTSVTIGESVTIIGDKAFSGCTGLKNLRIEDGTKTLVFDIYNSNSSNLFDGCPLDTVYLGRNYECINYDDIYYYDLFKGKTSLVSLTIGSQVTSIGSGAFYGCKGLTSVTIPESITSIGKNAFYNCTGLTSVTAYNPTPVNIVYNGISVFDGVDYETCKLYVLAGSVSTYKAAEGWKEFGTILPIEGYVPETGKDFIPVTVTPTDSAEVEALKTITLEFAETPSLATEAQPITLAGNDTLLTATLSAGEGNTLVVTLKCDTLTASGTYTLTIPEGSFGDALFASDPTTGHCNPELVYTYTIKESEPVEPDEPEEPEQDFEPVTETPEAGSEEISFTRVTLTFTEAPVLLDNRVMLAKSDSTVLYPALLTLGESNTLEITLRYGELKTEGTYLLNIPAGTVSDASGKHVNPEYTYVYTLKQEAGSVPTQEAEAAGITVYNLQGILMLQTDEAAELKTLPAGDYIVNGKKTVIAEQ